MCLHSTFPLTFVFMKSVMHNAALIDEKCFLIRTYNSEDRRIGIANKRMHSQPA